jgi:hypothetical protein
VAEPVAGKCQPVIALEGEHNAAFRQKLYEQLLDANAIHRVADRPDRYEPRLRKRRPKHYGFLRKPRWATIYKRDLRNGYRENEVPFADVTDAH